MHGYRVLAQFIPPPLSTTPITAMSSAELEQVVCRMLKLDRNWKSAEPAVAVRLKAINYFTRDEQANVSQMYLIPGGRWLLVLSSLDVSLWDLDMYLLDEPTAIIKRFNSEYRTEPCMITDVENAPNFVNLLVVIRDG